MYHMWYRFVPWIWAPKSVGESQLINSLRSMLINGEKLWRSYCKSVEVAQQQARTSIASMGKYGLLTLASIVGTDLRHPLLHLFHVLHFKQGHKLVAVKDYGDQVFGIEIDATLPDVCMQFNFESSVLGWMSWSASGAAAETWNCTVNQERAREEEASVQHGTSQLKHIWILGLLLTDAMTHQWQLVPGHIGVVLNDMSVSTFTPWLKHIHLRLFRTHFHVRSVTNYQSATNHGWVISSSCLKSLLIHFARSNGGTCSWNVMGRSAQHTMLQRWLDASRSGKTRFSLPFFKIWVQIKRSHLCVKLFVYMLCCAT